MGFFPFIEVVAWALLVAAILTSVRAVWQITRDLIIYAFVRKGAKKIDALVSNPIPGATFSWSAKPDA